MIGQDGDAALTPYVSTCMKTKYERRSMWHTRQLLSVVQLLLCVYRPATDAAVINELQILDENLSAVVHFQCRIFKQLTFKLQNN